MVILLLRLLEKVGGELSGHGIQGSISSSVSISSKFIDNSNLQKPSVSSCIVFSKPINQEILNTLGVAFCEDETNINDGNPILRWLLEN